MPTQGFCTVIVGCQWGDEGKGKIVDVLAEGVDIVARYQGGANAGHTVHVGEDEFILHQIPSGVLHPGRRCLLGNGVVLDIRQFFEEYDELLERGVELEGRVGVSRRAQLLLPYHKLLDKAVENAAATKIGTTGRGIGPAYEDKAGRRGLRVADLGNPERLHKRVAAAQERIMRRLEQLGAGVTDELEAAMEEALGLGERLLSIATDTGPEITDALNAGKRVLLEGAQGTALDLDHGTYPFVTSSNTTAASAATGTGIGPTSIDAVVGVVKAYTTRVGEGPLPSAFSPEMDEHVRTLGSEFGATTGRPRRCGWFDSVLARHAARVNGLTGLAVTKLDVLDTLPTLEVATAYRMPDGSIAENFPADTWSLSSVEPIYESLPGWQAPTGEVRKLEDLPSNARAYLDRIEELSGAPVRWVSVGTKRSQIIPVG
ncbi:MAG TPA: adenylosuccinate synthase [Gemmatimonadetes bacterium]|nr:adenylosuccinate synthase [Gemmatimonadota bacterium]HIN50028.1 adenylosuccinate synthase [Gemmatimonadota bacterium]